MDDEANLGWWDPANLFDNFRAMITERVTPMLLHAQAEPRSDVDLTACH